MSAIGSRVDRQPVWVAARHAAALLGQHQLVGLQNGLAVPGQKDQRIGLFIGVAKGSALYMSRPVWQK